MFYVDKKYTDITKQNYEESPNIVDVNFVKVNTGLK